EEFIALVKRCRGDLDDVSDRSGKYGVVDRRLNDVARLNQVLHHRAHRRTCHVSHPRSVIFTVLAIPPVELSASTRPIRSSGWTRNMTKPPPPAPDTFPASAPRSNATS